MRDIKQIYNSFAWGSSWIYGPSVTSIVLFSLGLWSSRNSTKEETSELIYSSRTLGNGIFVYYPGQNLKHRYSFGKEKLKK